MLIADHEWLLNLSKIFKGKKYIIRVRPSSSGEGSEDPTVDSIAVVKDKVLKLSEKVQSTINKRLDSVDVNTRFLIGYQQKSVEKVINKLDHFEALFEDQFVNVDDIETNPDMTTEQKLELKTMRKKKAEIMKAMNVQTQGQMLTVDAIQQIALQWMELADKDGNGQLDFVEFSEFFQKIEGIMVSDDEIKQMFSEFDGSGNNLLSVEEFARAIY